MINFLLIAAAIVLFIAAASGITFGLALLIAELLVRIDNFIERHFG
jgi:hypothetical protein